MRVIVSYDKEDMKRIKELLAAKGIKWNAAVKADLKRVMYGETLAARNRVNVVNVLADEYENKEEV